MAEPTKRCLTNLDQGHLAWSLSQDCDNASGDGAAC